MRLHFMLLIVSLVTLLVAGTAWSAKVEEGVDYNGWKCVKMSNENTEVYIATEIGGRIIQYAVDGHPFLWYNKTTALMGKVYPVSENNNIDNWKNYGGDKIWPAPQGWDTKEQWPGPGDEVIEAPYTYEVEKKEGPVVKVKIIGSDKGGYTGVQFVREFELRDGSTRLDLRTTMKNVSDRTVSWGIWSVTQMDFGDDSAETTYNTKAYLAIPMNKNSKWAEKYHQMFGLAENINLKPDYDKGLMYVYYKNLVAKIGMDVSAGWAAMVDEKAGYTYVQRFPYYPKATYPDNVDFEVWVNGAGPFIHNHKMLQNADSKDFRLIEMEILGPKKTLKPGESYMIPTCWEAYKGGLDAVKDLDKGFVERK